jgi:multidrug efflux pump
MTLIESAVRRTRTVIIAFLVIVIAGIASYRSMPKENEPDIAFPYINVVVVLEGVSPEDSERLLVRPLEQELRTVAGLKEMVASAAEGRASISLEFEPEVDVNIALQEVRERVDLAKAELPQDAEEPRVDEIKFSRFDPMLVMTLGGPVPERTLLAISRDLEDRLESLAGVLEATVVGAREEVLEIIVNPLAMESYGLSPADILNFVQRNNQLVAAGSMQGEQGRFAIKVPGVIESPEDVLSLPIKVEGDRVVHFEDIASVRRTFKDVESYARLNGEPSLAMEVVQRSDTNMIDTVQQIRAEIEDAARSWPPGVVLNYTRDKSVWVKKNLTSLVNNVAAAIVLVFIVLIGVLGFQNALLVGIAIPGSFCAAFFLLNIFGMTINMVVLFASIIAVGLLVDGAIVVTELADRKMAEGVHRRYAYVEAAKRMAWPIIASTATTLAAFLPLLFWPGLIGNFMMFFPVTLICILSASLVMALVVVPSLGSVIGRPGLFNEQIRRDLLAAETGNLYTIGGVTGGYIRLMDRAMRHPWRVIGIVTALLFGLYAAYGAFGRGITMWPEVEPNQGAVDIRAIGDLSTQEKDRLVRMVEERVYGIDGVDNIYVRSGKANQGAAPDQIGSIRLNFSDWRTRRPATEIIADIRARTADIAGLVIEARLPEEGPQQGKPINIEVSATDREALVAAATRIRSELAAYPGVVNAEDTSPLPGIEWRLVVDRAEAAKFGADVQLVGNVIQLVTTGIRLGDYRPDDADEEIDIRVRFPELDRSLDRLGELRIPTESGNIPIGTFVRREPASATGSIMRTDGRQTLRVQADLDGGVQLDPILARLKVQGRRPGPGRGTGLPVPRLRAGHGPDGLDPSHPVQQPVPGHADPDRRGVFHRRRAAGPAGDRAGLQPGELRHRCHRAGRHRGEQQHRADRHLQQDPRDGHGGARGHHPYLRATAAAGDADDLHHGPRPAAHGHGDQHRLREPRDFHGRSRDPVVETDGLGHRRRTRLRHAADAAADAVAADAAGPLVAAFPGAPAPARPPGRHPDHGQLAATARRWRRRASRGPPRIPSGAAPPQPPSPGVS